MDDVLFVALVEAAMEWVDDRFGQTAGFVVCLCLVLTPLVVLLAAIGLLAR